MAKNCNSHEWKLRKKQFLCVWKRVCDAWIRNNTKKRWRPRMVKKKKLEFFFSCWLISECWKKCVISVVINKLRSAERKKAESWFFRNVKRIKFVCYVFIIDLVNFLIEIDWADEVEEWKKKNKCILRKKKWWRWKKRREKTHAHLYKHQCHKPEVSEQRRWRRLKKVCASMYDAAAVLLLLLGGDGGSDYGGGLNVI